MLVESFLPSFIEGLPFELLDLLLDYVIWLVYEANYYYNVFSY